MQATATLSAWFLGKKRVSTDGTKIENGSVQFRTDFSRHLRRGGPVLSRLRPSVLQ